MTEFVVVADKLHKDYTQGTLVVKALNDVALSVRHGEFVSLVGPSGSGKSTLLHVLGALDAASAGSVRIDGDDLGGKTARALTELRLEKIGFVFQAFNLLPVLSALENVEFVLQLQGVKKSERIDRSRDVLQALGLSDLENRRPGDMSGGQQQRVAIARAIVAKPVLLLADEPSANLDTQTTTELCELLRTINSDHGMTIITATHDPLVMGFSSRRVELQDGRIVSDSPVTNTGG